MTIALLFAFSGDAEAPHAFEQCVPSPTLLGDGEEIAIVDGKITNTFYTIYGTVPHPTPGKCAMELSEWFYSKFKIYSKNSIW